ncbi:MAG: NADP-dependent phosphogluconate dehydrogenase [Chitinophagaceae bacterium]|nr:NADP-dependent phosphogluconate dehydrogenase [Chitinophagaceae bacterium]
MANEKYKIGMIGLGTMGRNLLLNMADHGFPVAGYDMDLAKLSLLETEGKEKPVKGFKAINEFVNSLDSPRVIVLLVPAGKAVDAVIGELQPLLAKGDIIIDAGNSHFTDTTLRVKNLSEKGLHFFGMGISGGEEGARKGPSMMPGGDKAAFQYVKPVLEAIAAEVDGMPCVVYIGPGASGHFVKMVHNGIEYALMQLISDTYEILRKGLRFSNAEIQKVFSDWNKGRLQSYLLEITSNIFLYKENGSEGFLIDSIKDEAKSKGTGKWTTQISTDLELPIPTIDLAVALRNLSKYKSLRTAVSKEYSQRGQIAEQIDPSVILPKLEQAFYFSMVTIYAQGMHLLAKASVDLGYDLKLAEIARIWRGGCIIRAAFLDVIHNAYKSDQQLQHLLLDGQLKKIINETCEPTREVVSELMIAGISIPCYANALSYFDALRSENMPSNLIQAQRDYFGAHTYELVGKEGSFHSEWNLEPEAKIQNIQH